MEKVPEDFVHGQRASHAGLGSTQCRATFTRRQARSGPNRTSGAGQMSGGGAASNVAA